MKLRRMVSAAGVIALCLGSVLPAHALDKGDKNPDGTPHPGRIKIGPGYGNMSASKSYDPVAGYTVNGSVNVVNPARCRQVTYCDLIRVDIDPGAPKDPYAFRAILKWPNPQTYDMDFSIFEPVFAEDDPETPEDESKNADGTPAEASTSRIGRVIGKAHPEVLTFGVDAEKGYYYLTAFQTSDDKTVGVPEGPYTFTIEMRVNEFCRDPKEPGCTLPTPSNTRRPSPSPTRASSNRTFSPPAPSPTLSPVKVPGPNGQLKTFSVPVLAQDRGPRDTGGGASPLVMGVIALALLGAGIGGFFFVRARRARAAGGP